MTSDAVAVVKLLFDTIWKLFTMWNIPGTHTSPAEWFVFLIATGLGLRVIRIILPTAADSFISFRRNRGDGGSGGSTNLPDVR